MDLGHWQTTLNHDYSSDTIPYGFIYVITNTVTGKKYIGKKQIKSVKKLKPLKGKKNKRHFDVETDWKTYTSSSNDVNEDIVTLGKDKFKFEIVRFCQSKFELAYFEAKLQFENDVLLKPGFYNGIINCRIGRAPKLLLEQQ
jgi:Putative endonuclease segE, GIY-YIG domain